jgi:Ca2+-binding RTX toxin-like protein
MAGGTLPKADIRIDGGPGLDVLDLRGFLLSGAAPTRAALAGLVFRTDPADGSLIVHAPGDAAFPMLSLLDIEEILVVRGAGSERVAIAGLLPGVLTATPAGGALHGCYLGDSLVGAAGRDALYGHGGHDLLVGNAGGDTLSGGDGADTLNGGTGDDFIYGGASSTDLRDVIYGGDGNDSLDGGYGNDEAYGGNGHDMMSGDFGADTLIGNDGDDNLLGGALSDVLFGNAGADTLNGGFGHDRLNGGAGADRFFHVGVAGHGSDWIQDYNAAEGDVLVSGQAGAMRSQFQVNITHTPGAGAAGVQEAFVIYRPTGQILWALVDGAGQDSINIQIGGQIFDLLA